MATPAANLCPSATCGKIAFWKCCFNWDHEIIDGQGGDLGGWCLEHGDSIPVFLGGAAGVCWAYLRQFLLDERRGQYLHPNGLSRALLCAELTSVLGIWLPSPHPSQHLIQCLFCWVSWCHPSSSRVISGCCQLQRAFFHLAVGFAMPYCIVFPYVCSLLSPKLDWALLRADEAISTFVSQAPVQCWSHICPRGNQ